MFMSLVIYRGSQDQGDSGAESRWMLFQPIIRDGKPNQKTVCVCVCPCVPPCVCPTLIYPDNSKTITVTDLMTNGSQGCN